MDARLSPEARGACFHAEEPGFAAFLPRWHAPARPNSAAAGSSAGTIAQMYFEHSLCHREFH